MDYALEILTGLRDDGNADFAAKLIPTVPRENILGCRAPALKKFAKDFAKDPRAKAFMDNLPHRYLEENSLHGLLIGATCKQIGEAIIRLDAFLPYVDNWATCDTTSAAVKVLGKHPTETMSAVMRWLNSGKTYTVRFAVDVLMDYFLSANFDAGILDKLAAIPSGEYYLDMAVAWYFSTALAKQYDAAIAIITGRKLPRWTHNKAIQKACESYRVPDETKAYLRTLKY